MAMGYMSVKGEQKQRGGGSVVSEPKEVRQLGKPQGKQPLNPKGAPENTQYPALFSGTSTLYHKKDRYLP